MNRWKLIFAFFLLTYSGYSQFDIDSSYTYKELNVILQKARKNYITKENKTVTDDRMMANLYFTLAESEENRYNFKRSFEYYTNSLSYYKKTKDTSQVFEIQKKIAERYKAAGMYEEAIELYNELLDYYKSKNDLVSTA